MTAGTTVCQEIMDEWADRMPNGAEAREAYPELKAEVEQRAERIYANLLR